MDRPLAEKQKVIEAFKVHLCANDIPFESFNHGYHLRVQMEGVLFNVYPTTEKVFYHPENKTRVDIPRGKLYEFFTRERPYHKEDCPFLRHIDRMPPRSWCDCGYDFNADKEEPCQQKENANMRA